MSEANTVNTTLVDTLTQIVLSLTEQERQLLLWQIQDPHPTDRQTLSEKLAIATEQIRSGEYTEYTDETLPTLLDKIRDRGQQRLDKGN
jgi:hypothetical protein